MIDKHNNGYFAHHQNPKITDRQSALRIAKQAGNQQNKSIVDYIWHDDHKILLITFSDN
jgi:hypothetical protein